MPHLAWIDALRGYAVLLVIASHALPTVPGLPWPVRRFALLGFFGVQLFFVVSAITLSGSWRTEAARFGSVSVLGFFRRRFFRIAPAYFFAALGYTLLLSQGRPDLTRVLTFLTFTNGWSPNQMPTAPGAWIGVPGGWSIEVEFAFYLLFPVLALLLRSFPVAIAAACLSLPLAWAANQAGAALYAGEPGLDQFLYYWWPNQVTVFLIGFVACLGLGRVMRAAAAPLMLAGLCLFLSLAYVAPPRVPVPAYLFLSAPAVAAAAFAMFTLGLSARPYRLIVNGAIVWLGQASFSAYLLHFAILDAVAAALPSFVQSEGVAAIFAALSIFALTLVATALVARLTYRWIELPFIAFGRSRRRRPQAA